MEDYRNGFKNVTVPIGDSDIELFEKLLYHGYDSFTWTFETDKGEPININFIKDTEDE